MILYRLTCLTIVLYVLAAVIIAVPLLGLVVLGNSTALILMPLALPLILAAETMAFFARAIIWMSNNGRRK